MRLILCLALTAIAGCTSFPELDAAQTPGLDKVAYPQFLPLETLLVEGEKVQATAEAMDEVDGRADALRARAEQLRNPVIDSASRDRINRGVTSP